MPNEAKISVAKPAKELAYPAHRQKTMQQKMNLTTDEKEHRTDNTRFAKSGNNSFDLKIIVKFEVTASFEDFG